VIAEKCVVTPWIASKCDMASVIETAARNLSIKFDSIVSLIEPHIQIFAHEQSLDDDDDAL
jgi:hypothetical protein